MTAQFHDSGIRFMILLIGDLDGDLHQCLKPIASLVSASSSRGAMYCLQNLPLDGVIVDGTTSQLDPEWLKVCAVPIVYVGNEEQPWLEEEGVTFVPRTRDLPNRVVAALTARRSMSPSRTE
jgi:hypothetical protein